MVKTAGKSASKGPIEADACYMDIADIDPRPASETRAETSEFFVDKYANQYAEKFDELPPLVVYVDSKGKHWLGDGHHRMLAAARAGIDRLPCVVRNGNYFDALCFAALANEGHGFASTMADRRKRVAVMLACAESAEFSDREIGRRCGVSNHTAAAIRVEVGNLPTWRIGKDGKKYPVKPKPVAPPLPEPAPHGTIEQWQKEGPAQAEGKKSKFPERDPEEPQYDPLPGQEAFRELDPAPDRPEVDEAWGDPEPDPVVPRPLPAFPSAPDYVRVWEEDARRIRDRMAGLNEHGQRYYYANLAQAVQKMAGRFPDVQINSVPLS